MDEKEFKKHLADLAHGHHHPEEHDWGPEAAGTKATTNTVAGTKKAPARKAKKKSYFSFRRCPNPLGDHARHGAKHGCTQYPCATANALAACHR